MSLARKVRGRATQRLVAEWYQRHGWPYATSRGSSEPGVDVLHMPGLAAEVKATADGDLLAALRQANRNAGSDLPFVVWRPNGYGEEKIGDWVVAMSLADHTELLLRAGYAEDALDLAEARAALVGRRADLLGE